MIIYLIGFMGTGKTSVSEALNKKLPKFTEYDMDAEIEARESMTVKEIFETKGEEAFRDIESDVLLELSQKDNAIISCGGGTVLREKNRDIINEHGVAVHLTATPETVLDRLKNDTTRPLLKGKLDVDSISILMNSRRSAYEQAARISVSTDGKTPEDIAYEIMSELFKTVI